VELEQTVNAWRMVDQILPMRLQHVASIDVDPDYSQAVLFHTFLFEAGCIYMLHTPAALHRCLWNLLYVLYFVLSFMQLSCTHTPVLPRLWRSQWQNRHPNLCHPVCDGGHPTSGYPHRSTASD
jgi:hypothetical protein